MISNDKHNSSIHQSFNPSYDDEINLLDYWRVAKKRKRLIGVIVGVVTVLSIIISLVLPKIYRSEAVIMPISGGSSGMLASMAAQLSSIPFLGGAVGGAAQQGTATFMALLKSRTLTEQVINRLDLMKIVFKDEWDEERGQWEEENPKNQPALEDAVRVLKEKHVNFMQDKKLGTITIAADFKSPELAADVANTYVEGLQQFISDNEFTVAKRNRIFIEKQLGQNKKQLLQAGKELNEFYKGGRISNVESRVDVPIIVDNEFGLFTEDVSEKGEGASDFDKLGKKISFLEEKRKDVEENINNPEVVKNVPQQSYLQYLALRRELLGKVNALLTQQYELAKIEEAKEELAFQVVDPGRVPIKKYKPKRSLIVMVSFITSFFLAIFLAFFWEYVEKMKVKGDLVQN